jgi:hypothetical protein
MSEPSFDGEPESLRQIEEALTVVGADLRATGLTNPVGLDLDHNMDPPVARVCYEPGVYASTSGIYTSDVVDSVSTLVLVADELQDATMEAIWRAWPVCPMHDLGAHPREHGHAAVWWCAGAGGHVIAPIGAWAGHADAP